MCGQSGNAPRILAGLAGRSHGVVTRRELLAAGLTERQIDYRIATDALFVEFPGVYRVGHRAPSLEARYMAAVKAGGEGGVLSGLAAAHLFGLIKGRPPPPEVSAPRQRYVKGLETRRRNLRRSDKTIWRGIPTTNLPRTLIDLSSVLSLDELAAAFHQASVRHRLRPEQVEARVSGRIPEQRGSAASSAATPTPRSASSSEPSSDCCEHTACRFRSPTALHPAATSTAAG
jgi:hypothetical protein